MPEIEELTAAQILKVASGKDQFNAPNSSAVLAIDELQYNHEVKTLENVVLTGAVLTVSASGGCAVVKAEFPSGAAMEHNRAAGMCSKWLETVDSDDTETDNQFLSMTVTPLPLFGQIFITLSNLVFADSYILPDSRVLIMCFDNNATLFYETDDIDYNQILLAVDEELRRQEEELDQEIEDAENARRLAESQNVYKQALDEKISNLSFSPSDDEDDDDDISDDSGKRTAVEENNSVRFVEEEDDLL